MKKLLALLALTLLPAPAFAWNAKGHMVVARLAWRQLSDDQKAKVSAVLKKHPHYAEYLADRRPDGFAEDEWAFMRGATWADWVRGKRDYDHPTWHYVNYPIVPPGSSVKALIMSRRPSRRTSSTSSRSAWTRSARGPTRRRRST